MIKIEKKLEYTLMLIKSFYDQELKSQNNVGPTSSLTCRELSQEINCSQDTVSKVLQSLTKAKVLKPTKGVGGGYSLIKDISDMTLFDLIQRMSPKQGIVNCIFKSCSLEDVCEVKTPFNQLNLMLNGVLKEVSLGDLLKLHKIRPTISQKIYTTKNEVAS